MVKFGLLDPGQWNKVQLQNMQISVERYYINLVDCSYLRAKSSIIVTMRQSTEIERPILDTTERAKFGA